MEGETVGIMIVRRAAGIVIEGGAADGNDIISIELPFDVLITVFGNIGMLEDDAVIRPVTQVFRRDQIECVAGAGGMTAALIDRGNNVR
jgi:hypothetical protein